MDITIRAATEDDLPFIRKLSIEDMPNQLFQYELANVKDPERKFQQLFEHFSGGEGNASYVAEDANSNELAGFLWMGLNSRPFSDMMVGWVYYIVVSQQHRGKGIGKKLMEEAFRFCKSRGVEFIGLRVKAQNKAAIKLYEDFSFETEHLEMTAQVR